MAARPSELTRSDRPALRVVEGGAASEPGPRVVAEILSDGTVRMVGAAGAAATERYATGQVAGDGWTIWWDRRSWT
jgi:hypothetical protein